jgi:hypothetical protein
MSLWNICTVVYAAADLKRQEESEGARDYGTVWIHPDLQDERPQNADAKHEE